MQISDRGRSIADSITLKLNAKAVKLEEEGKRVFNLTAGQLPFKPPTEFSQCLSQSLNLLKSYQYGPVLGFTELRNKVMSHIEIKRRLSFASVDIGMDCLISNGAKSSLTNILGAIINPGDEVVLLAPYWISYPEMIKLWGGVPKVVGTSILDEFTPSMASIKEQMTDDTKAIVLNSPNNPAGIHYSDQWMMDFAELLLEYPNVVVMSDEIYFDLCYFDPQPRYFYQYKEELLERTIIVDGISKSLACTGLRIGYAIGPKKLIKTAGRLQSQMSSGASSLVQKAIINFDHDKLIQYLDPIKNHLRANARQLSEVMRGNGLGHNWYQSTSAFYYLFDFTNTARFQELAATSDKDQDLSSRLSDLILDKAGIAVVPGRDFGAPNTARLSLVLDQGPFREAIEKLVSFLMG